MRTFLITPLVTLFIAFLMVPFLVSGQEETMKEITEYLQTGDADKLATVFNKTVDIGLPGKDNTYSVSQAEMVMKEFFRKYPPKSFTIEQQGFQGENSHYSIGYYLTEEKKLQVYTMIRKNDTGWVIHKLKFEEK